jgi:hypothetical protein
MIDPVKDDQPPLPWLVHAHVLMTVGFFSGALAALVLSLMVALILPEGVAILIVGVGAVSVGILAARRFGKTSNTTRRRFAIAEYLIGYALCGGLICGGVVSVVWSRLVGDQYEGPVYVVAFFGGGTTLFRMLLRRQRRADWEMFYE